MRATPISVSLEEIYPVPSLLDAGERALCGDVFAMPAPQVAAEFAAAELRLMLEVDMNAATWLRRRIAALLRRRQDLGVPS